MKFSNFFKSGRTIVIALTIGISSIFFIAFDDNDDFELAKYMDVYHTLVRELRINYVDNIEIANIFKTSIDQMLLTLDPYTVYYPESEIEEFKFMTTGQYGGIGALIRTEKDNIIIDELYENYPAQKAGIRVGDIIKKVGDHETNKKNYDDISILMKGMPDTEIEITVLRPTDNKMYTKKLIRDRIKVENVPYYGMINNNTGYINLSGFTQNAYDEVKLALIKLKEANAERIILDLRNNPGGLLIEAVNIVSLFVEKGTPIVNMKGKLKNANQNFISTLKPVDTQIPLCVIVNRNSASASEIVSGALQDLDRAVILGERTYGKGLVQETRDLSYNAKLKVTTAKYYIPSGRCIQALDYSHRNADGSVGYVPDSLISEFKTKSGRKVYDGGGISPDLKANDSGLSSISVYLLSNLIIFNYATIYAASHDSIAAPMSFKLTQPEYDAFINYAASLKLEYKSATQKKMDELIETAKKELYYKKSELEIQNLENSLKHNMKDDLNYFSDEVKNLLETEIVKRFYYRKGAILKNLSKSESIKLGIETLNDQNKLYSILNAE